MTNDLPNDRWPDGLELDDRYKIIELLAATKRTEVYCAKELSGLGQTVVIKRLKPDKAQDTETIERFRREATILRHIHHPSVLPIYDIRIENEECYFVTEFADQGNLGDYLKTQPGHKLPPVRALEIAASVCQGLDVLHRRQITHRDIKPGNILVFSQDDGSVFAKLGDFSIARVPSGEPLTETDELICTPPYAPPEQLETKVADPRSDVFSWAVVFFEMLSGESPDDSLKDPDTYFPKLDEFPLAFFVDRGISPHLSAVLQKALRKDQQSRYQSAAEVLEALQVAKPPAIADIGRHLSEGIKFMRVEEWQAACAEFERGAESCKWYGDLDRLSEQVGQLADKLQIGHFCAQGMIHMMEGQWQKAIQVFGRLSAFGPSLMGVIIPRQLELAQLQQQRENQLRLVRELKEQRKWTEVLREINRLEEIEQLIATCRGN